MCITICLSHYYQKSSARKPDSDAFSESVRLKIANICSSRARFVGFFFSVATAAVNSASQKHKHNKTINSLTFNHPLTIRGVVPAHEIKTRCCWQKGNGTGIVTCARLLKAGSDVLYPVLDTMRPEEWLGDGMLAISENHRFESYELIQKLRGGIFRSAKFICVTGRRDGLQEFERCFLEGGFADARL